MLSRNIYAVGQARYTNFCKSARVPVILTNEYTLILFLTDFATAYIFQATIKFYLSLESACLKTLPLCVYSVVHPTASVHPEEHQETSSIHPPTLNSFTHYHPNPAWYMKTPHMETSSHGNLLFMLTPYFWQHVVWHYFNSSVSVSLQFQIKDHLTNPAT